MRQFFPDVLREFSRIQEDWFSSQGRGSWEPLSPSYAAWKSIVAPGLPLLVLTGELSKAHFVTQQNNSSLTIKAEPPYYWPFHQFGTSRMPARPPYVIDKEIGSELGRVLREGIIRFMSRQ